MILSSLLPAKTYHGTSERGEARQAPRIQSETPRVDAPRARPAVHGILSGMDREFLEKALVQAERHVTHGEATLARQRATLAALERNGHNVALAKECLYVFEESQRLHVADRDRFREDLENANLA